MSRGLRRAGARACALAVGCGVLWTGTVAGAQAAPASTVRITDYRVTVEGVQTTAWTRNHVRAHRCDWDETGSGTEVVRFATARPMPVRVLTGMGNPVIFTRVARGEAANQLPVRARITRTGVLSRGATEACSEGDGTGGGPPAAPDCGRRTSGELAVWPRSDARGRIGLEAVSSPIPFVPLYRSCPLFGTGWPDLLAHAGPRGTPITQVFRVRELLSHGRYILVGSGRRVTDDGDTKATTTIRWSISFTRTR